MPAQLTMPCPLFHASEPLTSAWELRPVPLGRLYRGECGAGDVVYSPTDTELRAWCNFGYARGECSRFPPSATADAIRFSIACADSDAITVRFCLERDHRPVQHGSLIYHSAQSAFDPPHPDSAVNRLAEAYVESYLARRKS
jgi:hypothetical protein